MYGKNGYAKDRKYGSTIHTYELSRSKEICVLEYGIKGKLERLSTLGNKLLSFFGKQTKKVKAKINFGFFNFDGSSENLFTWSPRSTTVVYTQDNKLLLLDAEKLTAQDIEYYNKTAKFVAGASYTLVENGVVSIRHADIFEHANAYNPRTMIGQLKDGSLLLVVVQGRTLGNVGMTAKLQARLMKEYGCVTAVNLDGGGSSEMIVDGVIVNKPTDGRERPLGSSLIVYEV